MIESVKKRIGECSQIIKGKKPQVVSNVLTFSFTIPYVTIEAFEFQKAKQFTKETDSFVKTNKNDIVIVWDGSRYGLVGQSIGGALGSTLAKIIPSGFLNNRFMMYYLKYNYENLRTNNRGGGIPHLDGEVLKNIEIPVPSRSEQEKIVSILDKADELRQKKKESIEKSEKIIQALFYKMFGDPISNDKNWDIKKLSDIAKLNPGKPILSDEMEVSFIPMANINEKKGSIQSTIKKKVKDVKQGFTYFENNDVMFAKITPCMENGKSAIAENLTNGIGFGSTEFFVMRALEKYTTPEFLLSIIRMDGFKKIAKSNFTGTVGQQRVPLDFLSNFKVIVPPIEQQKKFTQIFREVKSIIDKNFNSDSYFNTLMDTLLFQAFSGDLTSRWRKKNKDKINKELEIRKKEHGF